MSTPIVTLPLADASDVVRLRLVAREAAAACGLDPSRQAWTALAVTEAAAGALVHAGGGEVAFCIADDRGRLDVVVTGGDWDGPEVGDEPGAAGPGEGLSVARRAADLFSIESRTGATSIIMGWALPPGGAPRMAEASEARAGPPSSWLAFLSQEDRALSELLDAVGHLDTKSGTRMGQLEELTEELEATNRGLIALHRELEDAKEAEARLAAIVRSSDEAMLSLSTDQIVVSWNPGAERLLGYSAAEMVGRPIEILVPVETRPEFEIALKRLDAGERAAPHDTWRRRRDGSLVEVTVRVSAIRDPQDRLLGYAVVLSDLTERRRTEHELAVARTDQEVLAERERIARDLHDLVIQRLFASGMSLQGALNRTLPQDLATRIATVVEDLDATIIEIRSTIFGLGQALRKPTSLRARILDIATKASEALGFQPRIHFDGPVDTVVPSDVAEQLVAVAREALSNVARHAHASRVELALHAGPEIVLEITDDGRGLGTPTRSSGLANMATRARALGGTFTVSSDGGAGTKLEWRVQLGTARAAQPQRP